MPQDICIAVQRYLRDDPQYDYQYWTLVCRDMPENLDALITAHGKNEDSPQPITLYEGTSPLLETRAASRTFLVEDTVCGWSDDAIAFAAVRGCKVTYIFWDGEWTRCDLRYEVGHPLDDFNNLHLFRGYTYNHLPQ